MTRGHGFLWIFLSLILQVLSLWLGKVASLRMHVFSMGALVRNGPYFTSLLCLGLQALVWPLALRRFPLLWAYLFMSLIYVAIPLVATFYFHEPITRHNIMGSIVIMAGIGVLLIGRRAQANG